MTSIPPAPRVTNPSLTAGAPHRRAAQAGTALPEGLEALLQASRLPMGLCTGSAFQFYANAPLAALLPGCMPMSGEALARDSIVRDWLDRDAPSAFTSRTDSDAEAHWTVETACLSGDRIYVFTLLPQTRRIRAEQALQASEEALATLMDQRQSLLMRCAPDGRTIWVNRRLRELAGIDDARDATWERLLDGLPLAALFDAFTLHQRDHRGFALHLPMAADAGRVYRLRFTPLFDTEGGVSAWSGSGVDVDEWHAAWLSAHASEPPVANAEDFVWRASLDNGWLVPLDPRERHDWSPDTSGQPLTWTEWCAIIRPEDRELALGIPARVAAGETVHLFLALLEPRDERKALAIEAFPLGMGPDGVAGMGGLFRPVLTAQTQQAYWIRCEAGSGATFECQRQLLARDRVRLLLFDNEATFVAVSRTLEPGVSVFEAPSDPARLFGMLEGLDLESGGRPWLVAGTRGYPLEAIVRLMRMGATDVLSSAAGPRLVAETIRKAMNRVSTARASRSHLPARTDLLHKLETLTVRERQVLKGLMDGGTNKVIAQNLKLSPRTVESHRAHLMDRLGVKTLAELLRSVTEANWRG